MSKATNTTPTSNSTPVFNIGASQPVTKAEKRRIKKAQLTISTTKVPSEEPEDTPSVIKKRKSGKEKVIIISGDEDEVMEDVKEDNPFKEVVKKRKGKGKEQQAPISETPGPSAHSFNPQLPELPRTPVPPTPATILEEYFTPIPTSISNKSTSSTTTISNSGTNIAAAPATGWDVQPLEFPTQPFLSYTREEQASWASHLPKLVIASIYGWNSITHKQADWIRQAVTHYIPTLTAAAILVDFKPQSHWAIVNVGSPEAVTTLLSPNNSVFCDLTNKRTIIFRQATSRAPRTWTMQMDTLSITPPITIINAINAYFPFRVIHPLTKLVPHPLANKKIVQVTFQGNHWVTDEEQEGFCVTINGSEVAVTKAKTCLGGCFGHGHDFPHCNLETPKQIQHKRLKGEFKQADNTRGGRGGKRGRGRGRGISSSSSSKRYFN
ncbi:hypothetical protein BOTBODRAFT_182410 [Botryobasidium botryosum FD-172 SS1]|uniref:Uncharacterized protein n=1 Tax=Botryobasidium botryosum (strain FD-172 SS1) TaxID=930990 RepID=A0A067LRF2_BOTB1|nr:hypothetical protein BOTBODRAFT_182410 [Botryobasidium botryosum FD-172 SS1]